MSIPPGAAAVTVVAGALLAAETYGSGGGSRNGSSAVSADGLGWFDDDDDAAAAADAHDEAPLMRRAPIRHLLSQAQRDKAANVGVRSAPSSPSGPRPSGRGNEKLTGGNRSASSTRSPA